MAESLPQTISDRADDPAKYQPLAPLAIAAIIVSGLVGLATLTLLLVGLLAGKRVLEAPLIFAAVAGIGLAAAARWQIRRSDGARGGTGLANISWWISLVCVLVYGAYYLGTLLSIRAQAQEFLDATWYPALRERKLQRAFYYTQPAIDRNNKTESDVINRFGDHYNMFRKMEILNIVDRSGGDLLVEPEGFIGEQEKQQTMILEQSYTVRTREGWFRGSVNVIRSTGNNLKGGAEYQAYPAPPSVRERRLSTYGRLIRDINLEGEQFIRDWVGKVSMGQPIDVYLDTIDLPAESRGDRLRDYMLNLLIRNGLGNMLNSDAGLSNAYRITAALGDIDVMRATLLPGYEKYASKLVIVTESDQHKGAAVKALVQREVLKSGNLTAHTPQTGTEVACTTEFRPDGIRLGLAFDCLIPPPLRISTQAIVYATLRSPTLMDEINRLKQMDWKTVSEQEDKSAESPLKAFQRQWVITEVHVDLNQQTGPSSELFRGGPGGPGGPMPPPKKP